MKREEIINAAKACVCGDRERDYGSPEDNFMLISELWAVYKGVRFSAHDVAVMMALLKIARIKTGNGNADSYVDLAGYAACAGEIAERQQDGSYSVTVEGSNPAYGPEQGVSSI